MKVPQLGFVAWFALVLFGSNGLANAQTATRQRPVQATRPAASRSTTAVARAAKKRLVFFGNSLTAGYGVPTKSNYPSLIAQKIDSAGLNYTVVNAGVSGETTAGGLRRVSTVLGQPIDVFVLELGANDVFRGVPVATIRGNLQGIIDAVRRKNPRAQIVIAGMQIPGMFGEGYISEFQGVFKDVATKNRALLIPYLLDNVGGVPELNLADGIHPTAAGYRIVARTVWNTLAPVLGAKEEASLKTSVLY
ncbi:arylesterase [Hymenobacter arizonensis]|uniref:Acyl-CoA thioesterase-1 n=1 Tax=Hymenobacter arizonensis TaxID=1227077 RepID=A0A1I5SS38_HYMAR|nr:arylesterase [Hymenobacter arizonensis]SFP73553.1 acyl-CoA thioesterase-1 [Hymenobacter arizonensis]